MKITIEMSMGELKEMLGNLLPLIWSENRIKPLSNNPNLSPIENKPYQDEQGVLMKKKEKGHTYRGRPSKKTLPQPDQPLMTHKEFVENVQKELNIKHNNHRPGRPRKNLFTEVVE